MHVSEGILRFRGPQKSLIFGVVPLLVNLVQNSKPFRLYHATAVNLYRWIYLFVLSLQRSHTSLMKRSEMPIVRAESAILNAGQ